MCSLDMFHRVRGGPRRNRHVQIPGKEFVKPAEEDLLVLGGQVRPVDAIGVSFVVNLRF